MDNRETQEFIVTSIANGFFRKNVIRLDVAASLLVTGLASYIHRLFADLALRLRYSAHQVAILPEPDSRIRSRLPKSDERWPLTLV
jgi:hypothetical protein